ncbi:MAG TPA: 5-amino-6-(D-ribitylamino)uracil--L-tyrosine 4-hydroxyphenyl transferase CofH [Rhizomicrobium sp.]|nr:5-amino-6-(D-ribitylamino)uracil--L-tyrosine 4-hydroxyphenyl transferase CofH [Rhizomicrobium sp.]
MSIMPPEPLLSRAALLDRMRVPLAELCGEACRLRDKGHGVRVSYSRKVFIPLTRLCRDVCAYCTFAKPPRRGERAYLSRNEVLAIARAGAEAGCAEALFTLGDKPERRYRQARDELAGLGHATTISYLAEMCRAVIEETGLLPHANPGVMTADDIAQLRGVTVSQGIMLENVSPRLFARGGVHFGSPDKDPAVRLATIRLAGEARVPFTSGILIGIGETREERLDSLLALRALHREFRHLQEIIIQNFRAKPDTRMAGADEPGLAELMWTIAMARLVFGPGMNIQAPPNLSTKDYDRLIDAGINDWGGVSPVTPDHVNPEAPWPQIAALRRATESRGKTLVPRLAAYPAYVRDLARWQAPNLHKHIRSHSDADGFAREDAWTPGALAPPDYLRFARRQRHVDAAIARAIDSAGSGRDPAEAEILALFSARGADFEAVCMAADALRRATVGDSISYIVNRNINYTNVCTYRCGFCAFSKGKTSIDLRGTPYDLAHEEVARRTEEAWARGAVEICMQGGIHPDYTGATYLELLRTVKAAVPDIHVHAFSPLEVMHGAVTLGISVAAFLQELKQAGLGTLPGTAAEILDDEVRSVICSDKLTTQEWLDVVETAHSLGLRTTSTIMYGHVETPVAWARHLQRLRELQRRTGGLTEFVPLPFVHMEAPMYLRGQARRGPTFREAVLMHAVARLALHPLVGNIQVSWVKMGPEGVKLCLEAGANDLGGTLMNESISRAAGTLHGQEFPPAGMDALIRKLGRHPRQRNTLYADAPAAQQRKSYHAPAILPSVQTPLRKRPAAHSVCSE